MVVSALGDAESLRGGTLLMTQLKGADGQTYGIAQGNLVVGGAGASAGEAPAPRSTSSTVPAFPPVPRWNVPSPPRSATAT